MNIRRTLWLLCALAVATNAWVWLAPRDGPQMRVTFLDVGQGDAILVRGPSGRTMLVDTGRRTQSDDSGRSVVLPYLRSQGINRLNALALTHPDDDHVGGARSILERMVVGRLLVSTTDPATETYRAVLDAAGRRRVPVTRLSRGESVDFHDGVVAEALNPPPDTADSGEVGSNDLSLVLRVRYGRTSVLLTGDAGETAERDMESAGEPVCADVLKLGHHGSRTASSEGFLDAVRPHVAIVSAGARNPFGHPSSLVLDRLSLRRVKVLRTDVSGAITVASDGIRLRFTTATHRL